MRYDEKEELEATGEWLLRINQAGFSEELMYVPSRLAELGVVPKDVVDRLDWLRDTPGERQEAVEPVEVLEQEDTEQSEEVSTPDVLEETSPLVSAEVKPLALDYESFGPWEWAETIENMIEDAIKAILDPEPDLPEFSVLALETSAKLEPQTRRKKRRRAVAPTTYPARFRVGDQLVGQRVSE